MGIVCLCRLFARETVAHVDDVQSTRVGRQEEGLRVEDMLDLTLADAFA